MYIINHTSYVNIVLVQYVYSVRICHQKCFVLSLNVICILLQFGEKGKMYLVRFLNSCVMVRVGGGWETLPKFLENNDPCRGWFLSVHLVTAK